MIGVPYVQLDEKLIGMPIVVDLFQFTNGINGQDLWDSKLEWVQQIPQILTIALCRNRTDRSSVFFKTRSTGKLAFLNNKIGVFEFEADENGNTNGKIWEWK